MIVEIEDFEKAPNTTNAKRQIYCVGLGIQGFSHLTLEALKTIQKAEIVLHIGLTGRQLERLNPNVKSLEHLYWSGRNDLVTYRRVAKEVIDTARTLLGPTVFAVDGNPAFFNDITWEIYARATKRRIPVAILAGISCLDVLAIDVFCDLGDVGTQIFEANQLVLYNLTMNPYLSTFILQIGWFGTSILTKKCDRRRKRFDSFISHLLKFYPGTHPAIFVMSSEKPGITSVMLRTTVSQIGLHAGKIHSGMTLYLPRVDIRVKNRKFYKALLQNKSTCE
jgi:hypothetical protein